MKMFPSPALPLIDVVSSRYIFKPIFHSFWLTHMLVNLPLQGPLRVYLCLACPLPSIAIGLPCTTTLVYQHLSHSPACNSVTMHHLVLYRTTPPSVHHDSPPRGYLTDHLPFPEYVRPHVSQHTRI